MMAYDLHGAYETKTGPNAPLKGHPSETGADRYMNDVRLLFVYESRDNQIFIILVLSFNLLPLFEVPGHLMVFF